MPWSGWESICGQDPREGLQAAAVAEGPQAVAEGPTVAEGPQEAVVGEAQATEGDPKAVGVEAQEHRPREKSGRLVGTRPEGEMASGEGLELWVPCRQVLGHGALVAAQVGHFPAFAVI